MCGLFGMIDYQGVLNCWQKRHIVQTLANGSEIRGQDATGIAYLMKEHIHIYKRALSAHKVRLSVPNEAAMVMGHTRLATQGSSQDSKNNHPFYGKGVGAEFALAHNGVLWNEKILRTKEELPEPSIETDSYIAVQLLEKEGSVNLNSLAQMAEKVCGSFTFTVLDRNGLYIVKGDSPFCLLHFAKGFYLYASTDEIMEMVLKKLNMQKLAYEKRPMDYGDILHIRNDGQTEQGVFEDLDRYCSFYSGWHSYQKTSRSMYLEDLCQYAGSYGITEDEIDELMFSYDLDDNDIEQLLYDPWTLRSMLDEMRYGCYTGYDLY